MRDLPTVLRRTRRLTGRRTLASALAATTAAAALVGVGVLPAHAAASRVLLRALVVTAGDPATQALAAELDREGIPYTSVSLTAAGRPTIDSAFLEDAAGGTARYQAVFLPNQAGAGLAAAELSALATYEATYGIRQVDGYDYPGSGTGMNAPGFAGALDGGVATVTPSGLSGPFSYLKGSVAIDNVDPSVLETYGYLATPSTSLPAGQTFTPLLTATVGSATGVLVGAYAHDGREEMVIPASFNQYMQWYDVIAPGIVSWATRGIHLGYQRNYFAVQVDDVFLPDSRWSSASNCTPGDGCLDATVTTPDIRMTPADVTKLVTWQNSNAFKLDMVFNAFGSDDAKAAGGGTDPLTDAFVAAQASFPWINHTYSHPFLGCIQIAPTVVGQTWHCATSSTETPRQDPEIAGQLSGGVYWAAPSVITSQVADNVSWAKAHGLTDFDPTELVTGEHSGLATLPQQSVDNPFLAPALSALGVRYTASDGSREADTRTLAGGATNTVPRHPMNIFYNAATFQDEVDEYNWIYTSAANGGSGICENNATSTCITPLASATAAQAKASFASYIQPLEVRNALKYVLTNDPRPFYAHQSNLAEDGILYPVVEGVLATYSGTFDTSRTPLVQTGLTEQYTALKQLADWKNVSASADGYVDAAGVHLPATSVAVPVTVPAGSTGSTLSAYAGALSGWVSTANGSSGVVVPPTTAGGYVVSTAPVLTAPGAVTAVTAVAGSTTASLGWAAPASDGGSPITGYVVKAYAAASTTAALTVTVPAPTGTAPTAPVTGLVTGLTNGTSYRFTVAAVNAVGTGAASALSNAVTPSVALAPVPTGAAVSIGNASAAVSWSLPAGTAGITGYRVRAYYGTSTLVAKSTTAPVGATLLVMANLANDTSYTFDVAAVYGTSVGPASPRTAAATASLTAQSTAAATLVGVTPASGSATVTWKAPVAAGPVAPSGYRVRAYLGATGTLSVASTTFAATATSGTLNGLLNGIGYSFEVTVEYPSATGATSARSAAVVPAVTVSSPPPIGSASDGTAGGAVTATARWSAPASTGGSAIIGYVVTASRLAADGSTLGRTTSVLLSSSTRAYAMTLPATGAYSFTVVARNGVGDSLPSAASNVVTGQ